MSSHSHNKIWIHLIWETLDHQKILDKETRIKVSEFLFNYSKEKTVFMKINFVNSDHVHALIDLPTNLSVEECIKLFKGASSHFINQNRLTQNKFHWGRGYGAFSVSESQVLTVFNYIKKQEEHHSAKSFSEEYQLFLEKYNSCKRLKPLEPFLLEINTTINRGESLKIIFEVILSIHRSSVDGFFYYLLKSAG